jgi:hypothetical protein
MSTNLSKTLERLAKMNSTGKSSQGVNLFFKPKEGKNNLIILPSPATGDPFFEYGTHKNLFADIPYKDVPCDNFNYNEECVVCQVVTDLQRQNWKGNYNIWKPLELKKRFYSPVIDLDNPNEGVKWWSYGKSVLAQFTTWLQNLDPGETEFYNPENLEKIIVTYNPSASPNDMYKLDKKPFKGFSKDQIEEWQGAIKPINEVLTQRYPKDEVVQLIEEYMVRIQEEIANIDAHTSPEDEAPAISEDKLSKLKR